MRASSARRCPASLTRCTLQIPAAEKLRLVLLFALRYERDGRLQVGQLLEMLGTEDKTTPVRAAGSCEVASSS